MKTDSCSVAGGYAGLQMQLRRATLVSCDRGEEKLGPHRQLVLLMYIYIVYSITYHKDTVLNILL